MLGRNKYINLESSRFRVGKIFSYKVIALSSFLYLACSINPISERVGYDRDAGQFTEKGMLRDAGYEEKGAISHYNNSFQGRRTANGETYDKMALTAAHRNLPFNTRIKVVNLSNGKSVIVKINDRGPYSGRRILDVSEAAARQLGLLQQGIAQAKISVL